MRKKKEAKWEREKAEIKVGDIFYVSLLLNRFVVTKMHNRYVYIMWDDGSAGQYSIERFKDCKKVGHIDISTWLAQIQTGGDDNE